MWLLTMFHFCVFVSLSINAVKLRAPVGPDDETDCSTRRCACRGVGQVRVFIVTGLVAMVTIQSPGVQWLCYVIHKCRVFAVVCTYPIFKFSEKVNNNYNCGLCIQVAFVCHCISQVHFGSEQRARSRLCEESGEHRSGGCIWAVAWGEEWWRPCRFHTTEEVKVVNVSRAVYSAPTVSSSTFTICDRLIVKWYCFTAKTFYQILCGQNLFFLHKEAHRPISSDWVASDSSSFLFVVAVNSFMLGFSRIIIRFNFHVEWHWQKMSIVCIRVF